VEPRVGGMHRCIARIDGKSEASGDCRAQPAVFVGIVVAALAAIGCHDGTGADPDVSRDRAVSSQLVERDRQSAEAGATLPAPIVVLVLGSSGKPVSGVTVRTSLAGGGTVTPQNASTGSDGRATFTWTLGLQRGIHTLTAQVSEAGVAAVTASATATRPLVTRLTLTVPISMSTGSVTAATATATDARGNAVNDVVVSWLSSNTAVATVTSNGTSATVTAIAPGTTTLSAATEGMAATQPLTVRVPFVEVSAGANHTCARTAEDSVYCWGWNHFGQLGEGTRAARFTPALVSGDVRFTQISAGALFTCGVSAAGAAYCWGNNAAGQLGDGTKKGSDIPVAAGGSLTFAEVSAGRDADCEQSGCGHTCARTAAGVAYCWGNNEAGELGDGTSTERLVPTPVIGGLSFSAVNGGGGHTWSLTASGAAYCWGYNFSGQLGAGLTGYTIPSPAAVSANVSFAEVRPGLYHTCARTTLGIIYCWGFNGGGQLATARAAQCFALCLLAARTGQRQSGLFRGHRRLQSQLRTYDRRRCVLLGMERRGRAWRRHVHSATGSDARERKPDLQQDHCRIRAHLRPHQRWSVLLGHGWYRRWSKRGRDDPRRTHPSAIGIPNVARPRHQAPQVRKGSPPNEHAVQRSRPSPETTPSTSRRSIARRSPPRGRQPAHYDVMFVADGRGRTRRARVGDLISEALNKRMKEQIAHELGPRWMARLRGLRCVKK